GAVTEVFQPGRSAPPLAVSLPSGELLLGKDNIGVLVDQNGKLIPEGRICWSEAPAVVVIQKPYAIALLPKHIEIRLLRVPYPLIQTIGLRNIRGIKQGNNGVIVSLDQSVYGLFPVPLGAQVRRIENEAKTPNCKRAWLRNDCKTQAQELKLKPNTFDCQTIISVTALYTKQQWFPPETSVLHDNEEPKWLDGGWKKLQARVFILTFLLERSDQTLRTPREERYERREAKKREREESITEVESFRSKKPKMRVIIPTERILISGIKKMFIVSRSYEIDYSIALWEFEDAKSDEPTVVQHQKFKPEMIIDYLKIEGAEDTRIRAYSSDGGESDSGRSDGGRRDGGRSDYDTDDVIEEGSSAIMLDEVLDVLIQRWDRVHGAKALRLLPKETKLQTKNSNSYLFFSLILTQTLLHPPPTTTSSLPPPSSHPPPATIQAAGNPHPAADHYHLSRLRLHHPSHHKSRRTPPQPPDTTSAAVPSVLNIDYGVAGDDYEGPPVFDDDEYEEEFMPVYDTAIEDVIEEEEGFVGKEGFDGEEDNIENVVVVANDLCSSMIQTSISVDFSKTINSNPHELIWLQKGKLVEINILIGKKYQGYLKAKPMDNKFGFKMIKVRGRVIIKKGNLMQEIQIWMLQVQGTSEVNSRTSFFLSGGE
nr:Vam6/Vps39-like protein [Tanacetum cinerariifolium]